MGALALFAIGTATVPDLAIWLVVLIGVAAIVFIVVKTSGVQIPPFVWQILGVVALIVLAVLAIRFIASM